MTDRLERHWFRKGNGAKPADFADGFFIAELEFQCEFGLRAFGEMQNAFSTDPRHPALIALAHALLVYAGNVAKILTAPAKASPRMRSRTKRIQGMLGLEGADFEQIRLARNYFEHFDERMDRFVGSHSGLLIHRRVQESYPTEVELDDGRKFEPAFLQFLETSTLQLILYDQTFSLPAIIKTLENIQSKAKEWLAARGPAAA
jgi:hypothetical protein